MEKKIKLEGDEETGVMAQLLRVPVALTENPSLVPSICIRKLPIAC